MTKLIRRIESLTTTTEFHQICFWVTNTERLAVGWLANRTELPAAIERLETLTEEVGFWSAELEVCRISNQSRF